MKIIPELNLINRGKVRDLYQIGENLLIVTTDRVSIYDVVLPNDIPDKGKILTRLSEFWFDKLSPIIPNHLITTDIDAMPKELHKFRSLLEGRSMLVKKAKPFPVECIVRGYLTGSGYKDYVRTGSVCGIDLPSGLVDSDKLTEVLFTPSTKAEMGYHDENISFSHMIDLLGEEMAKILKRKSVEIYKAGAKFAESKGVIIADTKLEFGLYEGEVILIDEVLTPDSSRFWPKEFYKVGQNQDSFDKQYLRDYYTNSGWNKKAPPCVIPQDVIYKTCKKYGELERLMTF